MSDYDEDSEQQQDDDIEEGFAMMPLVEKPKIDDLQDFDLEEAKHQTLLKTMVDNNKFRGNNDDEENLGENFEDSPWVPPSLQKAADYRARTVFRGSTAPITSVNMCRAADLGDGTVMYFQFLRSIGICFFVLTFLSIPNLFFSFWGSRMPLEDQDSFYFYRFAFGNIGYDKESAVYAEASTCNNHLPYYNVNETCISLPKGQEVSLSAVGSVLTFMEILQALAFFCMIWHLKRRLKWVETVMSKDVTSVTDYSIMIRNLPKDTTEMELIQHFSNLYPLDRADWKNRPALADASPVDEVTICCLVCCIIVCDFCLLQVENTKDSRYKGTWVAECFVVRKIGRILNKFLKQEKVTHQLRRARAESKMYSQTTTHAHGHHAKKYAKAMKRVERLAIKVDELAQSVIHIKALAKAVEESSRGEKRQTKRKTKRKKKKVCPTKRRRREY
jgi:hypothetical protein